MLKELYDRIKKFVIKKPPLLYAIALVITFIVPVIIARLVFSPGVLPDFPGSASEWFAFWASYSGAVVTVFVAVNGIYFYFSQFPRRGNLLKMTIEFQVTAADIQFSEVSSVGKGDEGTKRKADSNNKSEESKPISCIMELELEMLPVFDQEYRSNKVKLKSYSMRVGQIDKDNLDFQKLA